MIQAGGIDGIYGGLSGGGGGRVAWPATRA